MSNKLLSIAILGLALNFPASVSADHAGEAPRIIESNVHLRTHADGSLSVFAAVTVTDSDGIDTVSVTVGRPFVFGPFGIGVSSFLEVNKDSDTQDTFRRVFRENQIAAGDRAGEYEFVVTDEDGHSISFSEFLPSGLTSLPPGGQVTIDTSTGSLTPTVIGATVSGATGYRLLGLNDTDRELILYHNIPGPTMATEPFFVVTPGVLEPDKSYRLRIEAFDSSNRWDATLRSDGPNQRYEPVAPESPEELVLSVGTLDLGDGEINSLTSKLGAAQKSFDKGKDKTAANQLNAFINQILALERSDRVTESEADALIAAAEAIISGDGDGGGYDVGGH